MAKAKQRYDVCIIGGGVVGLTAAALLAEQKLSIALIDQAPAPKKYQAKQDYDLRVSAINLASMAIFEHLGVAQEILSARASAYEEMLIWDANSKAKITFNADDIDRNELGFIIENTLIISCLSKLLKKNNDCVITYNTQLESLSRQPEGYEIIAGKKKIYAQLIIGADGQFSKVRELAKLPTEMGSFNQTALVCRIQTENPHAQTAYQCFHQTGPIAYLPLSDGSCSIVWSCDTERALQLQQLKDAEFASEIEQALQSKLGAIKILSPRAGFELAQQHASQYVDSRLALIGDAAHRTHPLAGLGANLGLQDAAVLAEVIQTALQGNRTFYKRSTLRKYERIRKHQNALILDSMQAFKSGFASTSSGIISLRELALNTANNIAPLKQRLTQLATGIRGDLPAICQTRRPY